MSRTTRRPRPKFWRNHKARIRDGQHQYHSIGCSHNNSCTYCMRNRTHANHRREPLIE